MLKMTECDEGMKRILIIDDEENSYLSLRTVLENNGLTVDAYNNPHEALKNFSTGLYDLVLVDIIMPEMNGFELYRRLRIIDNKVKVFFLASGRVNYAMVRKELSSESDSNYIIRKPIENEDLIELLNIIVN
jgi:CheY-like chemotaxis protein